MTLAQRNEEGIVTMADDDGNTISAKIPTNRSMLGIIGVNGLISGGEYRNDGWVYWNEQPVRKWHTTFERIRIWEPKFDNLPALYRLYKKTRGKNDVAWQNISSVLHQIWKRGPRKNNEVIAHALPTHTFEWNKDTQPWWVFKVHNETHGELKGLSFSFNWIDEGKPDVLVNHDLGQKLYDLERRWWDTTCARASKVRTIFFEAMKRSLPKPTAYKVISMQFGEDTFWFRTEMVQGGYWIWKMFDDQYQFEIKKVI